MGHPSYKNPAQVGPGHIVGVTWDSALHKFGIDRAAGVWNDYGNPDRFQCEFDFGEATEALGDSWKGQRLVDGLPVIVTTREKAGVRLEVEQFAYPLNGPPRERNGEIPMVLLSKLTLSNLTDGLLSVPLKIKHRQLLADDRRAHLTHQGGSSYLETAPGAEVILAVEPGGAAFTAKDIAAPATAKPEKPEKPGMHWRTTELSLVLELPAQASRAWTIKLPSPVAGPEQRATLTQLNYSAARQATLGYWNDYIQRGARFDVPEPAVNELFRANLWHALRLPRRHGSVGAEVKMDLPYSNFAYDQKGTPWPVNQAVYVDYMLYDLRGYHDIAAEELGAIYRNNQEPNGHVGGYANWVVYTPGMIYSAAKNYLLSGDRQAFEDLLPRTLKALDWCLGEIKRGQGSPGPAAGLVRGPLNDGTGDGIWAFNQAYIYAGLETLGTALTRLHHPRAAECTAAAQDFRASVERAFGAATVRSPLVQLRDHTWSPYVPCEVMTPHRLLQQWYPTDVDTGATHLPRLRALAPEGALADYLLDDHEDNLYLRGWGMANEPVYNQQATAYLYRDEPQAVIRAFYSMMACAFSHSVFEPVEHRWTWGQYFGPPSTDGAWFELYRQMLIRETDDDALLLLQATPRKWLEPGRRIAIERAPTYYGKLSFTVRSEAGGRIVAEIDMPDRSRPKALRLRLRHPQARPARAVTVNGQDWPDLDRAKEWINISSPDQRRYTVRADY